MFGKLRIRARLFVILGLNVTLIGIMGLVAFFMATSINGKLSLVLQRDLPGASVLLEADRDLHQMLLAEHGMLLSTPGTPEYEKHMKSYTENMEQADSRLGKFIDISFSPEKKALVDRYRSDRAAWAEVSKKVLALRAQAGQDDSPEAVTLAMTEGVEKFDTMREHINKLTEIVDGDAAMAGREADEAFSRLKLILAAITFGSILVGGALTVFISGGITTPLRRMIAMLKDIAEGEGDLTRRIEDRSGTETQELAEWFNQFVGRVHSIIKDVAHNSSQVTGASKNLLALAGSLSNSSQAMTQTSNTVAASAEEMSANMNSVAASMEQFTVNIGTVATSSEEMSATITEISSSTGKAKQITGQAVSAAGKATAQVNELGAAAQDIGKVTEAISAISSQTNLLALNAAIEAARRRGGTGLRRRGQRDQGTGPADGAGHRGDQGEDPGHPAHHRPDRARNRPDQHRHRRGRLHCRQHRRRGGGTVRDHPRHRRERRPGLHGRAAGQRERGPGGLGHPRHRPGRGGRQRLGGRGLGHGQIHARELPNPGRAGRESRRHGQQVQDLNSASGRQESNATGRGSNELPRPVLLCAPDHHPAPAFSCTPLRLPFLTRPDGTGHTIHRKHRNRSGPSSAPGATEHTRPLNPRSVKTTC
jgi:methyl-accepting chemotaxis protein